MPSPRQRARGGLLGLACGDAVGTTLEFAPRDSRPPVTDMVGGGPFHLHPGQWTDDTSMALCLAESLLACHGFDARDQLERYVRWWRDGYLSSTGTCFDIGATTRQALANYLASGRLVADNDQPHKAGNGSLMRLAPVVLWYWPDRRAAVAEAAESSRTTHAAAEAVDACRVLAVVLCNALDGQPASALLDGAITVARTPKLQAIARGEYRNKPRDAIRSSGYSVDSLEAALWCVQATGDFRDAILLAANLGDDADTVAAITGQIAGALYGVEAIPPHWRTALSRAREIDALACRLLEK